MTDRWTALKQAMEKATAGPWRLSCPDDTLVICDTREIAEAAGDYDNYDDYPVMEANAAFIALARNELPALLEENERMRKALEEIDKSRYSGRETVTPDTAFEAFRRLNKEKIRIMDIARAALENKP